MNWSIGEGAEGREGNGGAEDFSNLQM